MRKFLLGGGLMLLAGTALAQDRATVEALASFQGTWAGTGESRTDIDTGFVPAECDLGMRFDWNQTTLHVSGSCDGAGAEVPMGGRMRVTDAGADSPFMVPGYVDLISSTTLLTETGIVTEAAYDASIVDRGTILTRTTVGWTWYNADGVFFTLVNEVIDPACNCYQVVSRLTFRQLSDEPASI